ncbi:MAG: methyltransferase domain-containing protein [Acidobacteria bacterium]|nr:methyltransferase domain-containing protein [Acidobacteriota bacterium]
MGSHSPTYLHGTSPEEQRRLALMNDLLNEASLREMGLRGGEKIIDFGCATGRMSLAMARAAGPAGKVVGIEINSEQIAEARRYASTVPEGAQFEIRQGDALAPPLRDDEWGTFDVVHSRFLLEHLHAPLAAVRVMARAVRPGGRVILVDDDHEQMRLSPEPPGLTLLWIAYMQIYRKDGLDPYIGRKLVALLHEAGLKPVRSTMIFFGGCAGEPRLRTSVDNLIGILRGARERILETGMVSAPEFESTIVEIDFWGNRPDGAFWYALPWAEATR